MAPEPCANESDDFAFEEGRFLLGSEAGGLIQIDFALEPGLLK